MRVITWRGRLNPVQTHPGEISNSTDSRLILAVVTRVPGSQVWQLEATGSGGFCEELQRLGRRMALAVAKSTMKARIFISAPQKGHSSGSTS